MTFQTFFMEEKTFFYDFVKSEGETAKTQLKSCQKKGFFEKHGVEVELLWFEYVASKANIADFPSRGDFELLMQLGSQGRELVLPPLEGWDQDVQLWVDLARSQSHRSRAAPGGGPARPRRRKR